MFPFNSNSEVFFPSLEILIALYLQFSSGTALCLLYRYFCMSMYMHEHFQNTALYFLSVTGIIFPEISGNSPKEMWN